MLREYGEYFREQYPGNFSSSSCSTAAGTTPRRRADAWRRISPSSARSISRIRSAKAARSSKASSWRRSRISSVTWMRTARRRRTRFTIWSSGLGEADCVIGSRWLQGAVLHQAQTRMRQIRQPLFPSHRRDVILDAHQGHAMPCKAMAASGRRKNLIPRSASPTWPSTSICFMALNAPDSRFWKCRPNGRTRWARK